LISSRVQGEAVVGQQQALVGIMLFSYPDPEPDAALRAIFLAIM